MNAPGKKRGEPPELLRGRVESARIERASDRTLGSARQSVQPLGVRLDLLPRHARLALGLPECPRGDEPAEVLVADPVLDEQGQSRYGVALLWTLDATLRSGSSLRSTSFGLWTRGRLAEHHLCANKGLQAGRQRRLVEPRRSIHAVAVHERHGGQLERRRPLD